MRLPCLLLIAFFCLASVHAQAPPALPNSWDVEIQIGTVLRLDPNVSTTRTAEGTAPAKPDNLTLTVVMEGSTTALKPKATALATLLKLFASQPLSSGSLTVKVTLNDKPVPAGKVPTDAASATNMLKQALKGHPKFGKIITAQISGVATTWVLFKAEAVQYITYDDTQYQGLTTRLAADLLGPIYGIPYLKLKAKQAIYASTLDCRLNSKDALCAACTT